MTDYFAILGQSRRPWLEGEALKDAFHRLGATLHPDVPGSGDAARFAALNTAYSVLREPAARLRHLLELTAPAALAEAPAPPRELSDLFMEIAGVRRRLDALLAKRKAASSPLTRALLASEEADLRRDLRVALGRLETAEIASLEEVRCLDSDWLTSPPASVASVVLLFHRLAYLSRWLAQTRESLFVLET
jgi:curved DNA-binding protein CbpA